MAESKADELADNHGCVVMKSAGQGSVQTCIVQCNQVSQRYRVGGTLGQLSVSSGGNYSLSDVIIQQPRPADPSHRVSLHRSPALSCHLSLSHSSHVLGRWEGGHTTEGRLQGSVLPHYFAGCFFEMSGKRGDRACL